MSNQQKHDDGGQAFPGMREVLVHEVDDDGNGTCDSEMQNGPGMTLQDYFAAKAMAAMIANPNYNGDIPVSKTTRLAYGVADAMIAERNRRDGR